MEKTNKLFVNNGRTRGNDSVHDFFSSDTYSTYIPSLDTMVSHGGKHP